MAGVSQQIPNYFLGMSEQPDQLKFPGQTKSILNAIPDVTLGLYKRPGSKRVGTDQLTNVQPNGSWFHYYRDEVEGSYIGQIASDGKVRVWSCEDGSEQNVWYHTNNSAYDPNNSDHTSITSYLTPSSATATEDIQALTINDTTYLNNRTKTVTTTGTTDGRPHEHFAYVEILRTENGRQYSMNLYNSDADANLVEIKRATSIRLIENTLSTAGSTGTCRGIGTQVFYVDSQDSYDTLTINVTDSSNSAYNAASNKKNLIFRITTLGQNSQQSSSSDDGSVASSDFKCNYSKTINLLHGGEGWDINDKVKVAMTSAAGGGAAGVDDTTKPQYTINVEKIETSNIKANIKAVRPEPTPFDADTAVTMDTIIGGITAELSGTSISHKVIGNGIYLYSDSAFNVEVTNPDLMRVMQSDVNNMANLPNQCKNGYIVKVGNALESEEDDIYLKFEGENGLDGNGNWVECAKPGIVKSFDASTMPHILQAQLGANFLIKKNTWADREVGDDITNPEPTFTNNKINKVLFFRNRLVFLSGENIITSKPGEFAIPNFWAETALTTSTIDPIDIACSSIFPSELFDGIELAVGLLVFSTNQQFLLTSDDTILNPDTAKLKSVSTYNYNKTIPPISLGTSIGYIDNSGKYSRFNEMSVVDREREPIIVETSKLVPSLLPKNINIISNSRENQIILFSDSSNNGTLYGLKYLNVGEQRPQLSWFKWKFNQPIKYHFIIDDQFYILDNDDFLQQVSLIQADDDESIDEDGVNYLVHLDNYLANVTGGIFNTSNNKTTFNTTWLSEVSSSTNDIAIIDPDGKYIKGTRNSNAIEVVGDWSSSSVDIGFLYDYQVDFPKLYLSATKGTSSRTDVNASLVIHRINLNFGKIGSYATTLTRTGKEPYTEIYESSSLDSYDVGDAPYLSETIKTIPVYERNKNVDITLKSTNPTPATLHSMSWEGDYSNKYYKRV
tara:strand:- start:2944 stop:5817 length:2874 start_codon:yes stop_codon:yes gene_type:complete